MARRELNQSFLERLNVLLQLLPFVHHRDTPLGMPRDYSMVARRDSRAAGFLGGEAGEAVEELVDEVLVGLGGGGEVGTVGAGDGAGGLFEEEDAFDSGDDDVLDGGGKGEVWQAGSRRARTLGKPGASRADLAAVKSWRSFLVFVCGEKIWTREVVELVLTYHRICASETEVPLGKRTVQDWRG